MLATCIHFMRGTPYVFQGEELGMTNAYYDSIEDYRDVESTNYYEIMLKNGKSEEEALKILAQRSRDNGRTPMQWSGEKEAGFTEGSAWLKVPENYTYINAEAEEKEEDSILSYYKQLIQLRKEKDVIADGAIVFLHQENTEVLAYRRFLCGQEIVVYNNLTGHEVELENADEIKDFHYLIGNYAESVSKKIQENRMILRPYEAIVFENKRISNILTEEGYKIK